MTLLDRLFNKKAKAVKEPTVVKETTVVKKVLQKNLIQERIDKEKNRKLR